MTPEDAAKAIADLLEECVSSCPEGVPAGTLYAGTMSLLPLETFEAVMASLVKAGRVRKQGKYLYLPAKK